MVEALLLQPKSESGRSRVKSEIVHKAIKRDYRVAIFSGVVCDAALFLSCFVGGPHEESRP
jgi:hypothetical protein